MAELSDRPRQHDSRSRMAQIEEWMAAYTDFEKLMRDYFLENGKNLPVSAIPQEFYKPVSVLPLDLKNALPSSQHALKLISRDLGSIYLEQQNFLPGLDVFIQKHPRYSESQVHMHEFFEICYVYSGSCTNRFFWEDKAQTIHLKRGDLLFIPPEQMHSLHVLSDSIILNIGVRKTTFMEAFAHNIPSNSFLGQFFYSGFVSDDEKIRYLLFRSLEGISLQPYIEDICLAYCTDSLYSTQRMNLQLSILFVVLLENFSESAMILYKDAKVPEQIPAVIHYIEENYTHITLKEVAKHFGYSVDYLNIIFERATSYTVGKLIMQLKMQKAQELLQGTDLPVAAIAEYLGYKDPANLVRSFKKFAGYTPSKFRAVTRADNSSERSGIDP